MGGESPDWGVVVPEARPFARVDSVLVLRRWFSRGLQPSDSPRVFHSDVCPDMLNSQAVANSIQRFPRCSNRLPLNNFYGQTVAVSGMGSQEVLRFCCGLDP